MVELVGYYYAGGMNEHNKLDIYKVTTPHSARLFHSGCRTFEGVETIDVSGKREARAILAGMGARPYNF